MVYLLFPSRSGKKWYENKKLARSQRKPITGSLVEETYGKIYN